MGAEEDIWWESSTSPGKRKRKKESKKTRKTPRSKGSILTKADHHEKRKEERKSKVRKKNKKKTKKKCVDFNQTAVPHKKSQRKRKVGFDLLSTSILVKDPAFASLSPKLRQDQTQEDECQREDVNSQDLFITQKTFRASTPDSEDTPLPAMRAQHAETWRHSPRKKKLSLKTGKDGAQNRKCFDVHGSLAKLTDASPRQAKRCKRANARKTSLKETASMSTQTQNFFTAPLLSSYVCRPAGSENVQPLDLSLPHRARRDLSGCLAGSDVTEMSSSGQGEERAPSRKDQEVKTEAGVGQRRGKGETTPSSASESETKSASSDCNPAPCHSTKVRPVQMKLNESFFFKTKGDGSSPRPESPLMKLTDGAASQRDKKGKKGR
nr:uncharacterized protein si:ch211-176l24.4 isoform X2 [Doryrhamphus excisus]